MNELVDVLDRLAVRGTPRGVDSVFDAAVRASGQTPGTGSLPDVGAGPASSSIEIVEVNERSTSRSRRRTRYASVAALVTVAAALATVLVIRLPGPDQHTSQPSDDSPPGTSLTTSPDNPPLVGVPALSSSIAGSKPTASAAAFGSVVAAVLSARDGSTPDLRETATRTTDQGQSVNYAYFGETDRRLFVLSGGPDLISSVPGLADQLDPGPQTATGVVLVWPEESWRRTIALSTGDSVTIISSEAINQTGAARSVDDLVELAIKVSSPDRTIVDAFAAATPGAAKCSPPSPIIGNEFRGTSGNGRLSGLIFATQSSMHLGDDIKLVVRMTGSGPLAITATAPDGTSMTLRPTPHTGSSFDRPGDEWDTGITYQQAGCWQIHFERSDSSADVWFQVAG